MISFNNQHTNNRLCTESELNLFLTKNPKELGLTEFSKIAYTYPNSFKPSVASIVDDIAKEVHNGEKYYFLKPTSPFVAKERLDKKLEWVSVDAVNGLQVEFVGNVITNKKDQSFYINTGGHGGSDGSSILDKPKLGLGGGRFILEDLTAFLKTPNVGLNIVNPGQDLRYPSKENHYIIAWCYSYRTAQRASQIALDLKQIGYTPNEFRCDLSGRVMVEPVAFGSCSHIFERSVIEEYMNKGIDRCPSKTGFFSTCNQVIDLNTMWIDTSKRHKIKMLFDQNLVFQETKNDNTLKTTQITNLTNEKRLDKLKIQNLEIKNVALTEENGVKDLKIGSLENENTDLKGRVTVLTEEKKIEKQMKKEAFSLLEEKEKQIVFLKKDPEYKTIKEFINLNKPNENQSDKDLVDKLSSQKNHSEGMLDRLLKGNGGNPIDYALSGMSLGRPNTFILNGFSKSDEEKHKRIIEKFLEEKKQDITQLIKKEMTRQSYDLASLILMGTGNRLLLSNEKFDSFITPLMDRLVNEGLILKRTNSITESKGVSIQELSKECFNEKEIGRNFAKSYEDTIKEILHHVFRIEICDQIIEAIA